MVRLLVLIALAGCYDPGAPTGRCEVACSTSGACPSGMTCTDGLCYGDGDEICSPADLVRRETIAAGRNHVCAIDTDRLLSCWGDNAIGQLGVLFDSVDEQRSATPIALDVPSHERWVAVAAGGNASCAIDIDGALLCWGDHAQLPLGPDKGSVAPTIVDPPSPGRWQTVTLGDRHGCAVFRPDDTSAELGGDLYCWGDNSTGQVGVASSSSPARVELAAIAGFSDWIEVGAGDEATCARRQGGTVFCFGSGNVAGTDAIGEAVAQPGTFFRISVGAQHACGSNESGQVFCWGSGIAIGNEVATNRALRVDEKFLPGDRTWSAIAAGRATTCALATTGEVRCFGDSAFGQAGRRTALDRDGTTVMFDQPPTDLAAGDQHVCGVTATGWACWGNNRHGQLGRGVFGDQLVPVEIPGGKTWTSVSAGDTVTCGTAGDAYCWGSNEHGLLGPGGAAADSITPVARSTTGNITSIAVASEHACFAGAGVASCWGDNDRLQLGTTGVASSDQPIVVADAAGDPIVLRDLVAGTRYSCGIDKNSQVACWGLSSHLGGTSSDSALPVVTSPALTLNKTGDALRGGAEATCAIHDTGVLSCWGTFLEPTIGIHPVNNPTPIDLPGPAVAIAIGKDHLCAHLGTDLACWGDNASGQIPGGGATVNTPLLLGLMNPDPVIAAGGTLTCLASGDGVVAVGPVCFGAIPGFQLVAPTAQFTDFAQISIGTLHACGVTIGGALACWGRNDHNQLGVGLGFDPVPAPVAR